MAKKGKKETQVVDSQKEVKNGSFSLNNLSNLYLWLFTLILAIVYFTFSTFSDGFYMHDEPMYYVYAKDFFKDPISAFKGFQRIAYVIFLALPSFGGFTFLNFFNSVLGAISVMYSYKIIQKLGGKNSFLIFLFLGLQPLWFMLVFRNLSEFLAAFLLIMTLWNHLNKRYIYAALLLSYVAFTRIEYHTILGLYFILLVVKKQWIPALLTGTFTLLHNFLGFLMTDDLLYLPYKVLDYSERVSGSYPKRGFDHYFNMSNVIFGGVTLTLFITYLGNKIIYRKKPVWIITICALFLLFFNCLINWQSVEIGAGNAGNLRYMIPILPLVGILAVLSVDDIVKFQRKYLMLIFLVPFLVLVGVFLTYDHNFMSLLSEGERYWLPLIFMTAVTVLIIMPLKRKHYVVAFSLLSLILVISGSRTFELDNEDTTMKKAGRWYTKHIEQYGNGESALFTENSRVACSHILFYHFTDKGKMDFINPPIIDFTKEDTDGMKVGDLVVWESHYAYKPTLRPTSQTYDFYDKSPNFEKIQYYQSKDKRFLVAFFRKIKM
ncbi:MAG: hypothetical protein JKY30_06230 [Flavobacteriales bacterium]|nr:hypothetical protein [Flavobacteriales bacterium]